MAENYTFETGLRLVINALIDQKHTIFPGKVESYDPTTMRAEIQPCIKRRVGESFVQLPKLLDVPIVFQSTGSLHIVYNPEPGSYALVLCAERSIEEWIIQGSITEPADPRSFDLSDAFAIPGLFPIPSILPVPCASGAIEIRDTAGLTKLTVDSTGVTVTGNLTVTGAVHAYAVPGVAGAVVDLATHVHSVTAAPGTTAIPTPIPGGP